MGGLMAKAMGLPMSRFLSANNDNKVFYEYLKSGNFQAQPSIATMSNAMDVGNPSNFVRILSLFDHDLEAIKQQIVGYTFSDQQTTKAIEEVYQSQGYVLDPHGSVGYLALREYLKTNDGVGAFLGTAHPAKFHDSVQPLIDKPLEVPSRLQEALNKPKNAMLMTSSFQSLKNYLLERFEG
jgi:threonine synthase